MKKSIIINNTDKHVFTEYQLKLVKRNHEARYAKKTINNILDVKNILEHIIEREDMDLELKEYYGAIFTNKRNTPTGYAISAIGSISGVVANYRELFIQALLANATGIIIFHNHPSGNPNPSDADKKIQKEIEIAAQFMSVNLIDNIILTPDMKLVSTM